MPPLSNSRYLVQASRQRHQQAREHAEQAIRAASRSGGRPTVAGIAADAGVSRSWLYTQDDLMRPSSRSAGKADAGLRQAAPVAETPGTRRQTALARNKRMRDEIRKLQHRLEAAHGEIRQLRTLAGPREGAR